MCIRDSSQVQRDFRGSLVLQDETGAGELVNVTFFKNNVDEHFGSEVLGNPDSDATVNEMLVGKLARLNIRKSGDAIYLEKLFIKDE